MDERLPSATKPWLWISEDGKLSCGAQRCTAPAPNGWHVLRYPELAELAELAKAQHTTLRCRCGAVEYDPASRTVRERRP